MKLSIKEYMETRKVSRRTIYNRIKEGQLHTVKEKNKTYIISENLKKSTKKENLNIAFLEEIKENITLIGESYNLIKNFNYNFISERLANIEKSLITFTLEAGNSNEKINNKVESLSNKIITTIGNIEQSNNNFLEKILIINEQNNNFFNTSLEKINEKIEKIENELKIKYEKMELVEEKLKQLEQLEIIDKKIDEILKIEDNKKSFGIFKK